MVVGFRKATYTVSEDDDVAIVTVDIFEGTVGDGESFSLQFCTKDNTAKSVY